MSFVRKWKSAKEEYAKATKEKKPGGLFEKLFGTGIEGALQKVDGFKEAKDLISSAEAFSKAALPYNKELVALAGKEKDAVKKKAVLALRAELAEICGDVSKLVQSVKDITQVNNRTVFSHKRLLDEFHEWTKKHNMTGGTYEIEFLQEFIAKTLDKDPIKKINYYFDTNEMNTTCTLRAMALVSKDPATKEFQDEWKSVCTKAQADALETLIDAFKKFQGNYIKLKVAEMSK